VKTSIGLADLPHPVFKFISAFRRFDARIISSGRVTLIPMPDEKRGSVLHVLGIELKAPRQDNRTYLYITQSLQFDLQNKTEVNVVTEYVLKYFIEYTKRREGMFESDKYKYPLYYHLHSLLDRSTYCNVSVPVDPGALSTHLNKEMAPLQG
jgi:hypothetical protein